MSIFPLCPEIPIRGIIDNFLQGKKTPLLQILIMIEKGGGGMNGLKKSVRAVLPLLTLLLALGWYGGERTLQTDAPATVEKPMIALTFDDGPMSSVTPALLDGLAQRGVKATFFLIGSQIVGNEDLVRRIEEEGHQIGIHTYDHVSLIGLNRADFDAQVEKTGNLLERILGHGSFLLRPPYGLLDDGVRAMAQYPIILWSVDPEDWKDKNTARVAEHIVNQAQDGDVVLLHDIYTQSVDAALQAVDRLLARGYLFVTVEELFQSRGITLDNGQVYRNAQ